MSDAPDKLVLLGATGSIGQSTLKVLRKHGDRMQVLAAACHSNYEKLLTTAREFGVRHLAIYDEAACEKAAQSPDLPPDTTLHAGMEGLLHLVGLPGVTHSLFAMVGVTGLRPAIAAIENGQHLILANKEILVMAGELITNKARQHGATLVPADSEHNALHQCLLAGRHDEVARILLTASGGSFRDTPLDEMARITPEQALQHPNWDMGPKVTIDSSTMANKGLEIIEARWLFDMTPDRIQVVVHPQSIVHSMVEYADGSILAQLSPPDMTFALQNALFHPRRHDSVLQTLDFSQTLQLDFQPPDEARFPCLRLAREALEAGGAAPAAFNAANEIGVQAFVERRIGFLQIPSTIESTLRQMPSAQPRNLQEVLDADQLARNLAQSCLPAQTH